jgi:hypothetical protein
MIRKESRPGTLPYPFVSLRLVQDLPGTPPVRAFNPLFGCSPKYAYSCSCEGHLECYTSATIAGVRSATRIEPIGAVHSVTRRRSEPFEF